MTPLLELQNVSFSYPEAAPALRNISLKVYPGERIAVLGNNGAGKSTFFLICNGILKPQTGSLFCQGQEITPTYSKKQLLELRQNVGIVFQDADNQIIASTVESEVSFGPMNLRLPLEQVQQQVDAALASMQLQTYRDRAPQNFWPCSPRLFCLTNPPLHLTHTTPICWNKRYINLVRTA